MENHVYDFILVANVFRGFRHELIDDFAEEADISLCVVADAGD